MYTLSYLATTYKVNYEPLNPAYSNRESKVQRKISNCMRQTGREEYHSIIQRFERSVIYRVQKIRQREQSRKTFCTCTYKVLEFSSIFYRLKANSIRHQLLFSFRFVLFCFALSRGTFLKKRKSVCRILCVYRRF